MRLIVSIFLLCFSQKIAALASSETTPITTCARTRTPLSLQYQCLRTLFRNHERFAPSLPACASLSDTPFESPQEEAVITQHAKKFMQCSVNAILNMALSHKADSVALIDMMHLFGLHIVSGSIPHASYVSITRATKENEALFISPNGTTWITGSLETATLSEDPPEGVNPGAMSTFDALANLNTLANSTCIYGAYFVNKKTQQLLRIYDQQIQVLKHIGQNTSISNPAWHNLRPIPELPSSCEISLNGSTCAYIIQTRNEADQVISSNDVRIIDIDAYLNPDLTPDRYSSAQGVVYRHTIKDSHLCCFALHPHGACCAFGYKGYAHIHTVDNLLHGHSNPHVLAYAHDCQLPANIMWNTANHRIISIDSQGTVTLHDDPYSDSYNTWGKSAPLASITPKKQHPSCLALNQTETHLAIAYHDGTVCIMPLINTRDLTPEQRAALCIAYHMIKDDKPIDIIAQHCHQLPLHIQQILLAWYNAEIIRRAHTKAKPTQENAAS